MYTILGVIAKPLGWLLSFLYGFIDNYWITIIVFTIIVKLCLYPLYIKQTKSMARMSEVQPKMQALQRKYANDKETLNIKMAEMYKEEKFNPMGGCLPMLIQMPIIMGLFALLRTPMTYMNDDSMLFAVHEKFLWIMDLSQPDKWILPIIAGIIIKNTSLAVGGTSVIIVVGVALETVKSLEAQMLMRHYKGFLE